MINNINNSNNFKERKKLINSLIKKVENGEKCLWNFKIEEQEDWWLEYNEGDYLLMKYPVNNDCHEVLYYVYSLLKKDEYGDLYDVIVMIKFVKDDNIKYFENIDEVTEFSQKYLKKG